MSAVSLEETIDGGELIAVVEDAKTAAEDQRWDGRPGYAYPRAEVDCILREAGRDAVVFVAQTVIKGKAMSWGPVILNVGLEAVFGEVSVRVIEERLGVQKEVVTKKDLKFTPSLAMRSMFGV